MTAMLPTKEWTITKGPQGSEDEMRITMMKERNNKGAIMIKKMTGPTQKMGNIARQATGLHKKFIGQKSQKQMRKLQ